MRDESSLVAHKKSEYLKLGGREMDKLAVAVQQTAIHVEFQIAHP